MEDRDLQQVTKFCFSLCFSCARTTVLARWKPIWDQGNCIRTKSLAQMPKTDRQTDGAMFQRKLVTSKMFNPSFLRQHFTFFQIKSSEDTSNSRSSSSAESDHDDRRNDSDKNTTEQEASSKVEGKQEDLRKDDQEEGKIGFVDTLFKNRTESQKVSDNCNCQTVQAEMRCERSQNKVLEKTPGDILSRAPCAWGSGPRKAMVLGPVQQKGNSSLKPQPWMTTKNTPEGEALCKHLIKPVNILFQIRRRKESLEQQTSVISWKPGKQRQQWRKVRQALISLSYVSPSWQLLNGERYLRYHIWEMDLITIVSLWRRRTELAEGNFTHVFHFLFVVFYIPKRLSKRTPSPRYLHGNGPNFILLIFLPSSV